MLESGQFRSIWWSNGGKCVAINEDLFEEEVLGWGGPVQLFAMQSVKSFAQQLNCYGFSKIHPDFKRSPSLTEFLAEEAAASTRSKVLYYYNPSFNREKPYLLEQCKRRVQIKRKALDALKMCEEHPSKSPKGQPAEDAQPFPPMTAPLTVQQAQAPPGLISADPSPPEASLTLPEPDRAAGTEKAVPAPFRPMSQSSQPTGAAPAPPLVTAASALPPPQGQSPHISHCPNTCSLNTSDASDAVVGTHRGTS